MAQSSEAKGALPSRVEPAAPYDFPFSRRCDPCGVGATERERARCYKFLAPGVASGSPGVP